jgi:hypothetical protein
MHFFHSLPLCQNIVNGIYITQATFNIAFTKLDLYQSRKVTCSRHLISASHITITPYCRNTASDKSPVLKHQSQLPNKTRIYKSSQINLNDCRRHFSHKFSYTSFDKDLFRTLPYATPVYYR